MNLRSCFILASVLVVAPGLSRATNLFTVTDLGTLGGSSSHAASVNASGQVVGDSLNATGKDRAFAYWHGTMIDLGTLGGDFSSASGINDNGQVVGWSYTAGNLGHAFLFPSPPVL